MLDIVERPIAQPLAGSRISRDIVHAEKRRGTQKPLWRGKEQALRKVRAAGRWIRLPRVRSASNASLRIAQTSHRRRRRARHDSLRLLMARSDASRAGAHSSFVWCFRGKEDYSENAERPRTGTMKAGHWKKNTYSAPKKRPSSSEFLRAGCCEDFATAKLWPHA